MEESKAKRRGGFRFEPSHHQVKELRGKMVDCSLLVEAHVLGLDGIAEAAGARPRDRQKVGAGNGELLFH